jgi:DNA gyrase subunit A
LAENTKTPDGAEPTDIRPVSLIEEMKRSYLDYAMSVIVSRALPDVRDGLKPVHRRILFSMSENGYDWNKPYRKSARVVGDVIGKYHPHGDASIYDALVRMAQPFSMRLPLVDGQGNFGSIDGDSAAAMRYTEVRLERVSQALTDDLDKDTVDFNPNYDGSEREPSVLPARFPNLLVNGSGGIAVGMATNIPSHNLGEVVDATIRLMDNPDIDIEELMEVLPGPDFPTGAMILGRSGIRQAFMTGRGSVVMRSRVAIEQIRKDREALIVTEIPYQVNKSVMVEKIAELVREKRVEGIADLRDESSRDGIRVVIELKRDAVADVVLNQLYRFSQLQTSFGVNMVALNGGRPQLMNLKDVLTAFVAFREVVVTRRTRFLLGKARDRAHVLVGLAIAVANIDEVIAVIRNAPDPATARELLMTRRWPAADVEALIRLIDDPRHEVNDDGTYNLSEEQARAILDLRLQRLTALGRDEISDELNQLAEEIKGYLEILASRDRVLSIIRDELTEIRTAYATPRRTEILESDADMEDEDLIAREEMVVTVSHEGYIKRVPLSQYRAQNRGGKGRSGMATKEEDFVTRLFIASTHAPVLFFSSRGIAYKLKVWRLPLGTPQSRGKFIKNILPLTDGERITSILALPEDEASWADLDVVFATRLGTVRRNKLSDFAQVNRNGKIAMKFDDDSDGIIGVETCTESDDFLLVSALGQCIRFSVGDVRVFKGRDSTGVRGISLADSDELISMTILRHFDASPAERAAFQKQWAAEQRAAGAEEAEVVDEAVVDEAVVDDAEEEGNGNGIDALPPERFAEMMLAQQFVLTVNEQGYGKRSSSYEFRTSGRGGKGIKATDQSKLDEIGKLIAAFPVETADQIMLVSDGGQLIRVPVDQIRIVSRASKGVRIFNTADGEKVVSVEHISDIGEEAEE